MKNLLNNYKTTLLKSKNPSTVDGYIYDIGTFLEFVKKRNQVDDNYENTALFLKDLNEADIFAFIEKLRNDDKSIAAINRKISALKSFFKFLYSGKIVNKNITSSIHLLKSTEYKEQNSLSVTDAKILINSINGRNAKRDKLMFLLILTTGISVDELINLNIDDILEEYIIVGRNTSQERYAYKNEALKSILSDFLLTVNNPLPESALFASRENKRISKRTVQQILSKRMQKSGFYTKGDVAQLVRRSGALIIFKYCNADMVFISKYLGHKTIEQTKKFLMFEKYVGGVDLEKNPLAKL